MATSAITLDDRELAFASAGDVLAVGRSIVSRVAASRGERADDLLRLRPADVSTRHWHDVAALDTRAEPDDLATCAAELRLRVPQDADAIWLVVPAWYSQQSLGSVLGLARALEIRVPGFVDAAVAAVAPLALDRPAVVIEMGLHGLAATLVESGEAVRRRRAVRSMRAGFLDLYENWLELVSGIMVNQTRFDPLHDAGIEQRLYAELPRVVAEAQTLGSAKLVLEDRERQTFEIVVARDQLMRAAAPILDEVDRLLRELRPATASLAFVMAAEVAALPGMRERLRAHGSGLLVGLPAGWSAAVASQLAEIANDDDSVRLLRRLAVEGVHAPRDLEAQRETLAGSAFGGPLASHVVHQGRAWPLSQSGIAVGRAGNDIDIVIPEGLAGVSRRHCTLRRESDAIVLVDHSRHGTWLNGERIAGRAAVQPGDRVRVGDPGVELALILVGAGDGQATPPN